MLHNGAEVHYRCFNSVNVAKPGLLFIHGMWAHSHWWDHIAPHFTDRFNVVALDLPGMGDSSAREQYTLRGFAEDVIAVSLAAAIAPTTIVAHSFGSNAAAFACHLRPDLVSRAIFIDSRLFLPNLTPLRPDEILQSKVRSKTYERPEDAIARYRLIPPSGHVDSELLAHIARSGLRKVVNGWTWKFDTNLDPLLEIDTERLIPLGIHTPVDLIYGEKSEVVSPATADATCAFFPNCGVPIGLPGAGHHILLEQPAMLIGVLRALLARPATQ